MSSTVRPWDTWPSPCLAATTPRNGPKNASGRLVMTRSATARPVFAPGRRAHRTCLGSAARAEDAVVHQGRGELQFLGTAQGARQFA